MSYERSFSHSEQEQVMPFKNANKYSIDSYIHYAL